MSEPKQWVYFDLDKEPMLKGVVPSLIDILDRARRRAKTPFVITSGYRDIEKNFAIGGVADSAHTKGLAVDLRCDDSLACFAILNALLVEGIKRIVIGLRLENGKLVYHNLHVDLDLEKPNPVIAVKLYGVRGVA